MAIFQTIDTFRDAVPYDIGAPYDLAPTAPRADDSPATASGLTSAWSTDEDGALVWRWSLATSPSDH